MALSLSYRDPLQVDWVTELGVSQEAVDLYFDSEVIDLHCDSFLWTRLLPGYDLAKRHRPILPGSALLNQVDLPRTRESGMAGMCWDIPSNPLRRSASRPSVTFKNIRKIADTLRKYPEDFALARTYSEYKKARELGKTASFLSLQGGQGIDHDLSCLDQIPEDLIHRITVVHLTESKLGVPSSKPHRMGDPLTNFGRDFVRCMQEKHILVDLAHINRQGFFDVLDCTDPSIPPLVTHTGIRGVHDHWRNLDDEQVRAIAERGGTVGIIYQPLFLCGRLLQCPLSTVIDHMQYVIELVGEDHVSLGSDYDGFIALPDGFTDITHQPKLVHEMLRRSWSEERIRKILGLNFLRVLQAVRP